MSGKSASWGNRAYFTSIHGKWSGGGLIAQLRDELRSFPDQLRAQAEEFFKWYFVHGTWTDEVEVWRAAITFAVELEEGQDSKHGKDQGRTDPQQSE